MYMAKRIFSGTIRDFVCTRRIIISLLMFFMLMVLGCQREMADYRAETKKQKDERMQWWRQARFGMFIHWGLYAIPAGEWDGNTNHAEWIRHTAKIPLEEYEKLGAQFNPVKFDADKWVLCAKDAGMKYIVITSKHHDGFCLWDSDVSEYDVIDHTPFNRDILAELSAACKKHDIPLCFYHSIMDWHHPDYLPRRKWENRSAEGADLQRYIAYMKAQLKELVERYDPAVLWFDGEWEDTWTHEEGLKLYDYVRSLKPDIIINNRVDKGRQGMKGMTLEGNFAGDFGTPEQEVPETGFDGVDWESCITMNRHWGWNKHDKDFKSSEYLIRQLVEITSKGGNYLLNVGPKADGTFPQESIERLEQIGDWMDVNGESIYGTTASPFGHLAWGRCTAKIKSRSAILYLHVFDWPADGRLHIPGLKNKVKKAYLLDGGEKLKTVSESQGVTVLVPAAPQNKIDTVVMLKVSGELDVENAD
jgi:alpha-L-fucosidase